MSSTTAGADGCRPPESPCSAAMKVHKQHHLSLQTIDQNRVVAAIEEDGENGFERTVDARGIIGKLLVRDDS